MQTCFSGFRKIWTGGVIGSAFAVIVLLSALGAPPAGAASEDATGPREHHRINQYAADGVAMGDIDEDGAILYPPLTEYHRYFSDEARWSRGFTLESHSASPRER